MRSYSPLEEMNVEYLTNKGITFCVICFTPNILEHGIFDATKPMKELLKNSGIHDFSDQKPGEKKFVSTHILTFKGTIDAQSSVYRAGTRGDKRMWLGREIYSVVDDDDICAIFAKNQELYVINISKVDVELCCTSGSLNPIKQAILSE